MLESDTELTVMYEKEGVGWCSQSFPAVAITQPL